MHRLFVVDKCCFFLFSVKFCSSFSCAQNGMVWGLLCDLRCCVFLFTILFSCVTVTVMRPYLWHDYSGAAENNEQQFLCGITIIINKIVVHLWMP